MSKVNKIPQFYLDAMRRLKEEKETDCPLSDIWHYDQKLYRLFEKHIQPKRIRELRQGIDLFMSQGEVIQTLTLLLKNETMLWRIWHDSALKGKVLQQVEEEEAL